MLDEIPLHEMKDLYEGRHAHNDNFIPPAEYLLGNLVTLREIEAQSYAPYRLLQQGSA